jgi:hypothetical protein
MEKMKKSFEIYPYYTLALNHLANHYFFTGQHFVVEQLTETALSSSNHGLLKSHAYYNLARSYHSKVIYSFHVHIKLIAVLFLVYVSILDSFVKNRQPHLFMHIFGILIKCRGTLRLLDDITWHLLMKSVNHKTLCYHILV